MSLSVSIQKQLSGFQLDVSFETDGGVLGLLGVSGCGKSMTLKCVAGLVRPDTGRIVLNGRTLFDSAQGIDLPPQQRRVCYLPQQGGLFPNMTVQQNLTAALHGLPKPERERRASELLSVFGLEGLAQRRPAQLSGGQRQRAALARSLLNAPDALLLDEPFTALDDTIRWKLELELLDHLRRYSGDVIYVSHSRDEVSRLCQTVCVLDAGRSEGVLPVSELMRNPPSVSAARISGCKNFSEVTITREGLNCAAWGVTLRAAQPAGDKVRSVGVRAHSLRLAGTENPIPCTIERVIDNVFSWIVMLKTPGGGLLRMELDKSVWQPTEPGSALTVYLNPEDIMLLQGSCIT